MRSNTDVIKQPDDDMPSEGPLSKSNYDRFNRSIKST
jgi:hypothetical protein